MKVFVVTGLPSGKQIIVGAYTDLTQAIRARDAYPDRPVKIKTAIDKKVMQGE